MVPFTCLIVDDSKEFLASANRLFSLSDVRVLGLTSSGDEALRLAAVLSPDVVLVDVELGDEDGIALARQLTSGRPSANVILISLREQGEIAELMAGSGVLGFVRKDVLDAQAVTDLLPRQGRQMQRPDV